jgi:uncharacterized protein (TIGR02231 family)
VQPLASQAIIQHVSLVRGHIIGADSPSIVNLTQKIDECQVKLQNITIEMTRLVREKGMLDQYSNAVLQMSNTKTVVDIETARRLIDFHITRLKAIQDREVELSHSEATLKKGISSLNDEVSKLRAEMLSNFTARNKKVEIGIDVLALETVKLSVTYVVHGAWWNPSYDVRVSKNHTRMSLTYFGEVRQQTGEDWPNCRLSLSTAAPGIGGTPPTLHPMHADFRTMRAFNKRRDAPPRMMQEASMMQATPPSASPASSTSNTLSSISMDASAYAYGELLPISVFLFLR